MDINIDSERSYFLTLQRIIESGTSDPQVLNESSSTLKSIALYMLNAIKDKLLKMYSDLTVLLDNYLMNAVSVNKRYRDILLSIPEDVLGRYSYLEYNYSNFDKYPVFKEAEEYEIKDYTKISNHGVRRDLEEKLLDNAEGVFGKRVSEINGLNGMEKFRETALYVLEGYPEKKTLTKDRLKTIIEQSLWLESSNPTSLRKKIKKEKEIIMDGYRKLKSSIESDLSQTSQVMSDKVLVRFKDAEVELDSKQLNDLNVAILDINAYYNKMINMYDIAYSVKLDVHKNRIMRQQELLRKILEDASVSSKVVSVYTQDLNKKITTKQNMDVGH